MEKFNLFRRKKRHDRENEGEEVNNKSKSTCLIGSRDLWNFSNFFFVLRQTDFPCRRNTLKKLLKHEFSNSAVFSTVTWNNWKKQLFFWETFTQFWKKKSFVSGGGRKNKLKTCRFYFRFTYLWSSTRWKRTTFEVCLENQFSKKWKSCWPSLKINFHTFKSWLSRRKTQILNKHLINW